MRKLENIWRIGKGPENVDFLVPMWYILFRNCFAEKWPEKYQKSVERESLNNRLLQKENQVYIKNIFEFIIMPEKRFLRFLSAFTVALHILTRPPGKQPE